MSAVGQPVKTSRDRGYNGPGVNRGLEREYKAPQRVRLQGPAGSHGLQQRPDICSL